jgi:short-subunit dehydrogenase
MPAIAIVGAGPGLGLSIAEQFGTRGYDVALISRNAERLDPLVRTLEEEGITAAAFTADAGEPSTITVALEAAIAQYGQIDVLEYSPYAGLDMVYPADVTVESLSRAVESLLYGAVAAVQTVLPGMLSRKSGSLLFTTGGGAVHPFPMLATLNIAQAGLRNWVLNLHQTLSTEGIHVGNVAVSVMIGGTAPEGAPVAHPDVIAPLYWEQHETNADPDRRYPA